MRLVYVVRSKLGGGIDSFSSPGSAGVLACYSTNLPIHVGGDSLTMRNRSEATEPTMAPSSSLVFDLSLRSQDPAFATLASIRYCESPVAQDGSELIQLTVAKT